MFRITSLNSDLSEIGNWVEVDPVQTYTGTSFKGTWFYNSKLNVLALIEIGHPSTTGAAFTYILKPKYKIKRNFQFCYLSYSDWTNYQLQLIKGGTVSITNNSVNGSPSSLAYNAILAPVLILLS